jgi:hypothetical protein
MRFRSWENRFVTTPVSVLVKKASGARMSVCKASRCSRAPARLMDVMSRVMPRRNSAIRALIWSKAKMPA